MAGVFSWWAGFVPAFVLTCVIEIPLYLVGSRWLGSRMAWPAFLLVNVATHPLLWSLALQWPGGGRLLVLEAGVVGVEAAVLWALQGSALVPGGRSLSAADCVLVSLLANAASALFGTWLWSAIMAGVAASASS